MVNLPGKQRGFSVLGWMLVVFVVGIFALVGLKVGPIYLDNLQIQTILKDIANEPDIGKEQPGTIYNMIDKRLNVNNIGYIKREHVIITKDGSKTRIGMKYDVQKPVVANIEFLLHFRNEEVVSNR